MEYTWGGAGLYIVIEFGSRPVPGLQSLLSRATPTLIRYSSL
jgi:hypothetical protein